MNRRVGPAILRVRRRPAPDQETTLLSRRANRLKQLGDHLFKLIASLAATISLLLTLVSYGFELGLLQSFHVQPEELQLSAFDYLARSWRPVVAMTTVLTHPIEFFFEVISWLVLPNAAVYVAMTAVPPIVVYLLWSNRLQWFSKTRSSLLAGLAKLPRAARVRLVGYLSPIATLLTFIVLGTGFAAALTLLAITGTILVSIAPLMAFQPGARYAQDFIIAPSRCRASRTEVSTVPLARCLRVVRNGVEVGRGRLVDVGQGKVLMYRKATDSVALVPIDGSSIEDVSTE